MSEGVGGDAELAHSWERERWTLQEREIERGGKEGGSKGEREHLNTLKNSWQI